MGKREVDIIRVGDKDIGVTSDGKLDVILFDSDAKAILADRTGRLLIEQTDTFAAILKELKKMNIQLAMMTDTWLGNGDVEV